MNKHPPNPEQIRDYLRAHGINGQQVAEMLRVSRRTVGHWMAGTSRMPYSVWFTLRTKVEGVPPNSERSAEP